MRWLVGLVALAAVALTGCDKLTASPHVILISIDTLRADHLAVYGYDRQTTPRLDTFFADGTVFENAMSPAPCTIPAVRQFLTGAFDVDPERKVLAEYLKENGYATAAVVSQHSFHRSPDFYRRGFDHFDIQAKDDVDAKGWTARDADEVTRRGLQWLRANAPRQPIFLWLHYFDPHDPYDPPARFRGFDAGNVSTHGTDPLEAIKAAQPGESLLAATQSLPVGAFEAEDWEHYRNLYDGEIQFVDEQIGIVFEQLDESGLTKQSIIAVISDHGEWLGEQNRWNHCATLREIEVHVPFLMRVNGAPLDGRRRVRAPVSTLDILPTVLGQLGILFPTEAHHGVDLRHAPANRVVASMWSAQLAVRNAQWKLTTQAGEPVLLHHLESDPDEAINRVDDSPGPRSTLLRRSVRYRDLRDRIQSERIKAHLRAIGYIH